MTTLAEVFQVPRWYADAQCAIEQTPVDLFYSTFKSEIILALEVCARCSVRAECDAEAKRRGDQGVWGGRRHAAPGSKRPKKREAEI